MRFLRFLVTLPPLLTLLVCGWTGCADDRPNESKPISSVPWNKPEPWESQGPLGGMMPGTN